jgi:hypothetical protein
MSEFKEYRISWQLLAPILLVLVLLLARGCVGFVEDFHDWKEHR